MHKRRSKQLFRIGDLPRDMREDLFNMYAISVNPEARERDFYTKVVPFGAIDIRRIIVDRMRPEQYRMYVGDFPPIVIADGHLIDDQHRINAARSRGETQLNYIDISGLIDIETMGSISVLPADAIIT